MAVSANHVVLSYTKQWFDLLEDDVFIYVSILNSHIWEMALLNWCQMGVMHPWWYSESIHHNQGVQGASVGFSLYGYLRVMNELRTAVANIFLTVRRPSRNKICIMV